MVLQGQLCGRVGRRRAFFLTTQAFVLGWFFYRKNPVGFFFRRRRFFKISGLKFSSAAGAFSKFQVEIFFRRRRFFKISGLKFSSAAGA